MITAEHLEENLDKLLAKNRQKEELFKFLARNEDKVEQIKKGALAEELGITRPTLNAWLKEWSDNR